MAANSGVNVLRYSALFAGIGYGLYHQMAINKKIQEHHNEEAIHHRESLVEKGKAEWVKKTSPPSDSGVISDPEDPNFDIEKYIKFQFPEGAKQ